MSDLLPPSNTGKLQQRVLLCVVVLIAAAARLPGLGSTPPPLNQDEASRGYDAWCLLKTGADRFGQSWPVFLQSFGPGDYTAALSTYITLPFVAVLGPTPAAIRLPDALLGVATVLVLAVWLQRRIGGPAALIAALCLALDPWHVSITRTAHEAGFAPFFMVMAVWALDRSGLLDETRQPLSAAWSILAGLMLALHAWVYPATRLFTPLFCIALGMIYRRRFMALARQRSGRRLIIGLVAAFLIGALPLWWTALVHRERLAARASVAVLDFRAPYFAHSLADFGTNFLKNVDPIHLFINANDMAGAALPSTGLHLIVMAPLIIAGLIRSVILAARDRWYFLLIVWIILGVIPAAICCDLNPHALRTIANVIPMAALAGVGAAWLLQVREYDQLRLRSLPTALGLVALSLNAGLVGYRYFRDYRVDAEAPFQFSLYNAMRFSAAQDAEFVLVTGDANQPYIYKLICEPVDPCSLTASPIMAAPGPLGYHQVVQVGKYFFMPKNATDFPEAEREFREAWRSVPTGAVGLVVETPGRFNEGELLATFHLTKTQPGDVAYEVRRWRKPGGAQ